MIVPGPPWAQVHCEWSQRRGRCRLVAGATGESLVDRRPHDEPALERDETPGGECYSEVAIYRRPDGFLELENAWTFRAEPNESTPVVRGEFGRRPALRLVE